jgi:hypothetical protein
MKCMSLGGGWAVVLVFAAALAPAQGVFVSLNPAATFWRTGGENPPPAPVHSLASLGLTPGGWCTLEEVGDWAAGGGYPDAGRGLVAVFSTSSTLLDGSVQNRVPGGVGTGASVTSGPTFYGGLPTDMPTDFFVSHFGSEPHATYVRVPLSAQFVFFAAGDSLFSDNSDPDGDYGVMIVPEIAPLFAGTSDDMVVASGVNAVPTAGPGQDLKLAAAGDVLTVAVTAPFGTLGGASAVFGAHVLFAVSPPVTYYGVPELWVDPLSAAYLPLMVNFAPLPTGGISYSLTLPPGLSGLAVMVQGVLLTPSAWNGVYAAANAHRIVFL